MKKTYQRVEITFYSLQEEIFCSGEWSGGAAESGDWTGFY